MFQSFSSKIKMPRTQVLRQTIDVGVCVCVWVGGWVFDSHIKLLSPGNGKKVSRSLSPELAPPTGQRWSSWLQPKSQNLPRGNEENIRQTTAPHSSKVKEEFKGQDLAGADGPSLAEELQDSSGGLQATVELLEGFLLSSTLRATGRFFSIREACG